MKEKNLFLVELEDYAWHLCESVKLARLLHRLNELASNLPNCGETAGIKEFAEYADSRTRELYRNRGPAYLAMLSGEIDDMAEVADAELAVPHLDIYVCCNLLRRGGRDCGPARLRQRGGHFRGGNPAELGHHSGKNEGCDGCSLCPSSEAPHGLSRRPERQVMPYEQAFPPAPIYRGGA